MRQGSPTRVTEQATQREREALLVTTLQILNHDLRTALQGMLFLAGWIQSQATSAIQADCGEMEAACQSARVLLDTYVDPVLQEPLLLQREEVDLGPLVQTHLDRHLNLLTPDQRRHVEVRTELRSAVVQADVRRMGQALDGVLANALQSSLDGATLDIAMGMVEGRARFSLRDGGCDTLLESLAELPDDDRARRRQLRWWLCQRVIEAHGGAFAITRMSPQGAEVGFALPGGEPVVGD
ncbi:MAG TPA: hypothetical protein VGO93_14225 [Candidatus Xenobia bacterium]